MKSLTKSDVSDTYSNDEELKVLVKSLQLDEWRRKYDAIDNSYDRIRSRSITLLTIQIGVISYFITRLETLIKSEIYGVIFLIFGSVMALVAIGFSIQNYRSKKRWSSPMYELEIEKMNQAKQYSDALDILLDDYRGSYDNNCQIHEPAAKRLNQSLFIFIGAAIILLALNF